MGENPSLNVRTQTLKFSLKSLFRHAPSVRMTKQRCEAFFDNDDNFALGEFDIVGMLTWAAEKMGRADARVAHA